ncbi:exodeoxyribonuclease III [Lentisphaerota bacterium ZTH]|nr:exodeoxyribonuclease III [Lentisphaerota bacterium]WET06099.1 exodeoxyribonuclease III [Lentisphaerota bacterium ZTH]
MKLISWNVNGIRAVEKKGFVKWLETCGADIVCLQETKAREEQLSDALLEINGYHSTWCSGERKGYSGVATYANTAPASVERGFGLASEFDNEGRILVTEFEHFTLLNIYFPNGQKNEERLQYKLRFYDAALEYCEKLRAAGRSLVICGDYNTAHNEIDIARPKENENVSGFLRIERDWMDKFESYGYIDTFRQFFPDRKDAYSWWSYRTRARDRNIGWRLDYFYISPELLSRVKSAAILNDVMGSDHCPVMLELNF